MNSSVRSFSWSPFPQKHERVACVNILLLLALPMVAYGLHLVAMSSAWEVNFAEESWRMALTYLGLSAAALLAWRRVLRSAKRRVRVEQARETLERCGASLVRTGRAHPRWALILAAVAGMLVSCYPVVFGGKSFVSPNNVGSLFYGNFPTVPNPKSQNFEDVNHVDTAAMLFQHQPYSVIEGRALFHDHELPVWNRYNSGGLTLIGQGLSMLGDPLNWLVVLAGGGAGAWDLKFLVARVLFALGIGLCVRAATGRLTAALVLAFGSGFLGFFSYRLSHPAYFAVCDAPWILFAWLRLVRGTPDDAPGARGALRWVGLLLLACWLELSSGVVKEVAMLLLGLNGIGVLILLLDERRSWRWKRRALAGLAWAGASFGLVSAPLWRTLLESLAHAWNNYQHVPAYQLQPSLLISLFDDIFARQYNEDQALFDPSASFLILLGVAFALASFRRLAERHRAFVAVALGCLPPLALVFGVVPPVWIRAVPFLGNVMHIDNTFTCVLLVPLTVLAGYGLEHARQRLDVRDWAWDYAAFAAVPLALLALFLGGVHAVQQSQFSPLPHKTGSLPLSSFCVGYTCTLVVAVLALPLLGRWWRRAGRGAALGVVPAAALCLGALLWRGGLQEHALIDWDPYVMHMGPRQDVHFDSPGVNRLVAATRTEPGRVLGFDGTLMGGYTATYGLESPYGPDALQNRWLHGLLAASPVPYTWDWQWSSTPILAASPMRSFYDLLNIRFYAAQPAPGTSVPAAIPGLRTVGRCGDLDLYESPTAWPRAFFTDELVPGQRNTDVFRALGQGGGRPFALVSPGQVDARPDAAAFAALLRPLGQDRDRTVVPATDYRLTSRTTSFRVRATGPGVAVLMEGYQLPYNARVFLDGRPVEPLRVNEAFMGVRVSDAGEHAIRVVYGPRDLPLLLGASLLGLALMGGTAWWVRRGRGGAARDRAVETRRPALPQERLADTLVPVA